MQELANLVHGPGAPDERLFLRCRIGRSRPNARHPHQNSFAHKGRQHRARLSCRRPPAAGRQHRWSPPRSSPSGCWCRSVQARWRSSWAKSRSRKRQRHSAASTSPTRPERGRMSSAFDALVGLLLVLRRLRVVATADLHAAVAGSSPMACRWRSPGSGSRASTSLSRRSLWAAV